MKLTLNRIYKAPTYTIGKLYIDGEYYCDVIEDKVRDFVSDKKIMHETAIPFGTYEVVVNMSNRFKRLLPLLLNVPYFEGIRIHNGKDETSSSGCLIVGENKIKGKVINSTFYMNDLTNKLLEAQNKKEKNTITIEIL